MHTASPHLSEQKHTIIILKTIVYKLDCTVIL